MTHPAAADGGVPGSPAGDPGPVAAAVADFSELRRRLEELHTDARARLGGDGALSHSAAAASGLRGMVNECRGLQRCIEGCLERLALPVVCAELGGATSVVDVRPAVDTVWALKRKIAEQHGHRHGRCRVELASQCGTGTMRNEDLLIDCGADAGLTVTVVWVDRAPDLQLRWEADGRRWVDATGRHDILCQGEPLAVGDGALLCRPGTLDQLLLAPRGGGPFPGVDAMPDGIAVASTGWSCSFFTQAPRAADNDGYYCRILVGAKPDVSHVGMNGLRIGNYDDGHREVPFDMSQLGSGWHHVCVVADAGTGMQAFWVDGACVGELPAVLAPIFKIGNSSDGPQPWACPVQDFQLFLRPLAADEVRSFFEPARLAPGEACRPTNVAVPE